MKRLLILFVVASSTFANQQDGSLNTYNGDESNYNSNNTTTTTDESTSNTYNGAGSSSEIPVGSAITPTYMSNSIETCLQGSGSSLQTVLIGWSRGKFKADPDCNRRRDAKLLSELGMKVAAVARMCQDNPPVWKSMFISGTPCPILKNSRLVVGKKAFLAMKMNPGIYIPDYEENSVWYDAILNIGETDEQETSTESISDMFRSTKQRTRQPD